MARAKSTDLTSFYIGKEVTFGVGVAPTRHIKETGAVATLGQETVESKARLGSRWESGPIRVGEQGQANLPVELDPDNAQILFALLCGNESVVGSSDPYTHIFSPVTGNILPSATLEYYLAGWQRRRALGCVLNQLSIEISPKQIITATGDFIYKTETELYLSIPAAAINATTDVITVTAHGLADGTKVKLFPVGAATFPAGLEADKDYYVVDATADDFALSLTSAGPAIDIGSGASGTFHLVVQPSLSATTELPFVYNDASVFFDSIAFGELRQASLTFSNNLNAEDYRFNLQGQLYAIRAGKFSVSGRMTIVYNEDSRDELTKVKTSTATAVEIRFSKSANRELVITLPSVRYRSYSWGDGDLTLDVDFVGVMSAPIFTLKNGRAYAF